LADCSGQALQRPRHLHRIPMTAARWRRNAACALIAETEEAITAADTAAQAERVRALDPVASPDPIKARAAMEDAAWQPADGPASRTARNPGRGSVGGNGLEVTPPSGKAHPGASLARGGENAGCQIPCVSAPRAASRQTMCSTDSDRPPTRRRSLTHSRSGAPPVSGARTDADASPIACRAIRQPRGAADGAASRGSPWRSPPR
jgi:hypothetical protein